MLLILPHTGCSYFHVRADEFGAAGATNTHLLIDLSQVMYNVQSTNRDQ